MVQDSHSVLYITGQKIDYISHLQKNVKEIDIYELFGLKATACLRNNCSIYMPQLQSNGILKRLYIKPLVHVFNETKLS